jgi:Domain of unknown function (DUF4124)
MRMFWIAVVVLSSPCALAQTTIYKHVDEQGRTTYSNKPMKGASVLDLEPLTTIPGSPAGSLQPAAANAAPNIVIAPPDKADAKPELRPAVAIVVPLPAQSQPQAQTQTMASVDTQTQRKRDDTRRKILDQELQQEEKLLAGARDSLMSEQQNPELVAAVRVAQLAADPTPSQQAEFRRNIDKASGRIRGLQATVADHEKNVEALKKELGALKP